MLSTKKLPVTPDNPRINAKHVSKACLECRSRHLKCSGSQPCARCDRLSKACNYVKSHRGGSRKKGVSKFANKKTAKTLKRVSEPVELIAASMSSESNSTTKSTIESEIIAQLPEDKSSNGLGYNIPPVEDLMQLPCINHKQPSNKRRSDYADLLKMPCAFTCLEPQYRGRTPPCMGGEVRLSTDRASSSQMTIRQLDGKTSSNDYVKKMMNTINLEEVILVYYKNFHCIHPILPNENEIRSYLGSVPHAYELIIAMKIVGDAQSSSLYANDIETVNFKLNQIFDYINTIVGVDVISLQAMALVSLISHFSSLHDLSARVRIEAIKTLLSQGYNMVDHKPPKDNDQDEAMQSPQSEEESSMKSEKRYLSSERLSNLSEQCIMESIRKLYWEFHYIDVVIGTADGKTISKLATSERCVDYPHSVSLQEFDYKSRAEGCQLVTDAINLSVSVIDRKVNKSFLSRVNASLGSWDLRFNQPDSWNAPYMIDSKGKINEGVFQAMLLYNYSRIFAHRPFSYLWKDSPADARKEQSSLDNSAARKIIETRKTIEGANLIATCLLDTSSSAINKRTPLYGCSIAFAALVHLSSYIWGKSVLTTISQRDDFRRESIEDDLKEYLQFLKFELNALFSISRHWMLANKLSAYIKDNIRKVSPELYLSVKESVSRVNNQATRQISIAVEPQVKLELPFRPSNVPRQSLRETSTIEFLEAQAAQYLDIQSPYILMNGGNYSETNNDANEIDFTYHDFSAGVSDSPKMIDIPDSPVSDTGCNWIDSNIFEFDENEFSSIFEGCGP